QTCPGLHADAHCVGLRSRTARLPRAARTCPGLHADAHCVRWVPGRHAYSGLRGLALGYTLSPTPWVGFPGRTLLHILISSSIVAPFDVRPDDWRMTNER